MHVQMYIYICGEPPSEHRHLYIYIGFGDSIEKLLLMQPYMSKSELIRWHVDRNPGSDTALHRTQSLE